HEQRRPRVGVARFPGGHGGLVRDEDLLPHGVVHREAAQVGFAQGPVAPAVLVHRLAVSAVVGKVRVCPGCRRRSRSSCPSAPSAARWRWAARSLASAATPSRSLRRGQGSWTPGSRGGGPPSWSTGSTWPPACACSTWGRGSEGSPSPL